MTVSGPEVAVRDQLIADVSARASTIIDLLRQHVIEPRKVQSSFAARLHITRQYRNPWDSSANPWSYAYNDGLVTYPSQSWQIPGTYTLALLAAGETLSDDPNVSTELDLDYRTVAADDDPSIQWQEVSLADVGFMLKGPDPSEPGDLPASMMRLLQKTLSGFRRPVPLLGHNLELSRSLADGQDSFVGTVVLNHVAVPSTR